MTLPAPYYESPTGLGRLYCGDCLEILPHLGPVDAVVTDPPYGISYQSARRTDKESRFAILDGDNAVPIEWIQASFPEGDGIASLMMFCRWDTAEIFRMAIENSKWHLRTQCVWDRLSHGLGDLKAQHAPRHDIMWFATKGDFCFPGKRPTSMYRSMREPGGKIEHPTPKPIGLMVDIVKDITRINETVLDPFLGSGTTAVACERLGRRWIGIEISEDYCAIAARRIAAETRQRMLFT